MKKPVLKWKTRNRVIMALAYAHRYLYPMLIPVIPLLIGRSYFLLLFGLGLVLYGVYTCIGYQLRWKHIGCSLQFGPGSYFQEVDPMHIRWGRIRKRDVYGPSLIFGMLGIAAIVIHFVFC